VIATLRALLVASACWAIGCHGRPRTWSPPLDTAAESPGSSLATGHGAITEIDLSRGAPETASAGLLGTPTRQTYFRLMMLLKELAHSADTRGVLVRFGSAHFGWAHAEELAGLLARVRESKKPVVCHADGYGNATSWMAARGCDRIWVSPAGDVETVGIAAEMLYAHRLLAEKLGVSVDFLQIGKFKGAEEPLTRQGPSPEAKASLEGVLGAIREQWLVGMEGARGQAVREAAEDGPFSAGDAKTRGLVDEVGYLDQARDDVKNRSGAREFDVRFGGPSHGPDHPEVTELFRALAGGSVSRGGPSHVALVRAIGAISMESSGSVLGNRAGITERALGRTVRALTEDTSVKAVVLRIDSPGGSALASDLLWRALMQLRAQKPLVVSVGDMAASGGYYLASTAHRIVAEPTSIVGSIGVVGGKIAVGPALENLGVHVEAIGAPGSRASTRASYESALLPWDPATRERVRAEMTAVYELFVRRVAEGRGVPTDVVAGAAEGRIFAGQEAKNQHLVDEWGGLERALAVAKELAHLDESAPVRISGETGGIIEWLDDDSSTDDTEGRSWMAAATAFVRSATRAPSGAPSDAEGALLGSLMPLVRGETTLAALPFGLLLR
jgi:protease-4